MALVASSFNSELTLSGLFDFVGSSMVGNVSEFSGGGMTPGNLVQSRLIQTDQQIDFRFQWDVSGIFTHVINPACQWEIELLFEQYGPGEQNLGTAGKTTLSFGSGNISGNTVSFPGNPLNSTTISLLPNTITANIYDVVAVIRLLHPGTNTPCFLAAFAEFGKIQFYQEH